MAERLIYDFPGKCTSRCWRTFGFYKIKPGPPSKDTLDMTMAVCKLCKKIYANKGNTSNFLAHINTSHPELEMEDEKPPWRVNLGKVSCEKPQGQISKHRKDILDDALMRLIVGKGLPVSLVENEHFIEFVSLLDSKYPVPSKQEIMQKLQTKKVLMNKMMEADLRGCSSAAITNDAWMSMKQESFNTTSAHIIDSEWNLKTLVLGTKKLDGLHTTVNIANCLQDTKSIWNLPHSAIATTDNLISQKAFQLLNWDCFGCYGNKIKLAVKHVLEIPEVVNLLEKVRKLVTFMLSSLYNDELIKCQAMSMTNKELVLDVPSKWNSTLNMLQGIIEFTPVITALANDESMNMGDVFTLKICSLNLEEQQLAEHVVSLLEPFKKATEIVCSEETPTMHKVLPVVLKLQRITQEDDSDLPILRTLKAAMRGELERETENEEIAVAACVLNPYTKDFHFMPQKRTEANELLRKMSMNMHTTVKREKNDDFDYVVQLNEEFIREMDQVEQPPTKRMKLKAADTEDWLDDIVCTEESKVCSEALVEKELSNYFGSKIKANMNVLEWWKINNLSFPCLSKLARQFLCCQASSAKSERVFCFDEKAIDKKRSRLSSENLDLFVFLSGNMKTYW